MQYRRYNFAYNFITMAACDIDSAWKIILNEINELSLDDKNRQLTIAALASSGINIPSDVTAREFSLLVLNQIYNSATARQIFIKQVLNRHLDIYVDPGVGIYDQVPIGNITDIFGACSTALDNMVTKPDEGDFDYLTLKKLLLNDLANKQKMRNHKIPVIDRIKNAGPIKVAFTILAVSGLIYMACRIFSDKPILQTN